MNIACRILKKSNINLVTIKSPYKSNIQVTKGMTFKNLISFIFPSGPPEGKRFTVKSSLDPDGKQYLPEQLLEGISCSNMDRCWENENLFDIDDV